MFLHAVSRFYEDGSPITPPCPQKKLCAQASSHSKSQHKVLSSSSAGQERGLMDCRRRVQEENKEQCYVPSLTVHPQSILTQEETNVFYSTHTQQKALKLRKDSMARKHWMLLTQSPNKKGLCWNSCYSILYKAKSQHSDSLSGLHIPGKAGTSNLQGHTTSVTCMSLKLLIRLHTKVVAVRIKLPQLGRF